MSVLSEDFLKLANRWKERKKERKRESCPFVAVVTNAGSTVAIINQPNTSRLRSSAAILSKSVKVKGTSSLLQSIRIRGQAAAYKPEWSGMDSRINEWCLHCQASFQAMSEFFARLPERLQERRTTTRPPRQPIEAP